MYTLCEYTLLWSIQPFPLFSLTSRPVLSIFKIGSHELFARLASNRDPPDLPLESPMPGYFVLLRQGGSHCIVQISLKLTVAHAGLQLTM
jgi:hypothetical protein